MVHPDYQYSPRLVPAMASMIASEHYDVVLGSRILGGMALKGGIPLYKYMTSYDFKIGELSCPTRYLKDASSINFRRSVKYGFGVIATIMKYILSRLSLKRFPIFCRKGRRLQDR
jgi:hypothetical protein